MLRISIGSLSVSYTHLDVYKRQVLHSVLITVAMAVSATTAAGILAFLVSLFGSEYISPFPRLSKAVRGAATFLRNIPALVWAFILFSSLGIGTGVGFVALFITLSLIHI